MNDPSVILQYLQSIEGKLDRALDNIDGHGTRINAIEQKQAERGGIVRAVIFISGLISAGISLVASLFNHN